LSYHFPGDLRISSSRSPFLLHFWIPLSRKAFFQSAFCAVFHMFGDSFRSPQIDLVVVSFFSFFQLIRCRKLGSFLYYFDWSWRRQKAFPCLERGARYTGAPYTFLSIVGVLGAARHEDFFPPPASSALQRAAFRVPRLHDFPIFVSLASYTTTPNPRTSKTPRSF